MNDYLLRLLSGKPPRRDEFGHSLKMIPPPYGDQAKQFNPNRQPTIPEFVCIGIMVLAILGTVALFLYGAVRWASAGDYLAAGVTGAAGLAILPLAWLEFRDQHRRNEMERDRHAERLG